MKNLFLTAIAFIALAFASQAQETKDQGKSSQLNAAALIKDSINHSEAGKAFTDWKLPSTRELGLMSKKLDIIGGFTNTIYWTSDKKAARGGETGTLMNIQLEGRGVNGTIVNKPVTVEANIRAIRSF